MTSASDRAPALRLRWLAIASALCWAALVAPTLVHSGSLLDGSYRFLSSWVLGEPGYSARSGRVDGAYFIGWMLALGVAWILALALAARAPADQALRRVAWTGALGFALIGALQVPFSSADPFYYHAVGRVVAEGGNPYVDPVERVIPFVNPPVRAVHHAPLWGPPMLSLLGAVTALVGADPLVGVTALHLVMLLFHLFALWLVERIAREMAPGREAWALVFYGWCPLIVFEHAGIGHNDPPMLVALLVSVWCVQRNRIASACVAVGIAFAFKAPGALAAFPLALYACLREPRRGPLELLRGGLLGLALLTFLYVPFWAGRETFSGLLEFRAADFGSLPQGLRLALGRPPLPSPDDPLALSLFWHAAFGAGSLGLALALARRRPGLGPRDYVEALVIFFLLYLATEQRYFWSWYATWAVAFAGLLPPGSLFSRVAIAFAVSALLGSGVHRFVHPLVSFTAPVQSWAIAITFAPPLLVACFGWLRPRAGSGSAP